MDGVKWKSESKSAEGESKFACAGIRNEEAARQARREAYQRQREERRQEAYCKLCAGGLKIGERNCQHGSCSNTRDETRAYFVQKALARREEKLGEYGAFTRQNAAYRKQQLEKQKMQHEDYKSREAALEAERAKERRVRFETARSALEMRIAEGFSPCAADGRRQYFARTGLARKAARLPLEKPKRKASPRAEVKINDLIMSETKDSDEVYET